MRILAAALLLFAAPATAQVAYPPPDLSGYATSASVSSAISSATSGLATSANLATVQAATQPCASPFPQNSLNGSAGSAGTCAPRSDATVPTNIQAMNATLDASCNWSVTFARSFVSSSPIVKPTVYLPGATQPFPCIVTARSATASSGKCWPAQTVALNLTNVTAGITVAPFGTTCTIGTAVMIVAREPTQ